MKQGVRLPFYYIERSETMKKLTGTWILLFFLLLVPCHSQAKETIILHVGVGKEYQTITEAIDDARELKVPCIIEISSGIYKENIVLLNDTMPITFKGTGQVFVISSCTYPYSTVYCAGNYSFSNITFIQTDERCYAGHVEYCDVAHPTQCDITFDQCLFITEKGPAFGIGTGENTYTVFRDCQFISVDEEQTSLFLHNYPGSNTQNQKILIENCYFNQNILMNDAAFDEILQNSKLEVILKNVTIDGEIIYTPDTNKIDDKLDYVPDGQDITLFVVN